MITIDDFQKINMVVGTVESIEEIEGSEKLYKLMINIGLPAQASTDTSPTGELRQILSGLKSSYQKDELLGKQVIVLTNLEPRKMMGLESQGMILAASDGEGRAVLLQPLKPVENGSIIK